MVNKEIEEKSKSNRSKRQIWIIRAFVSRQILQQFINLHQ